MSNVVSKWLSTFPRGQRVALIVFALIAVVALVVSLLALRKAPETEVTAPGEPPLGKIPTITSPDQVDMPIYEYLPSIDDSVALVFKDEEKVNACLASGGSTQRVTLGERPLSDLFDVFEPATIQGMTTVMDTVRQEDVTYSSLWGFFNPATVEQYGYDRADGVMTVGTSGDYEDAAVSQCVSAVDEVTPAGHSFIPFTPGVLPDGGPETPVNDSRYVDATKSWSACMADHGFSYQTPADAILSGMQVTTDAQKAAVRPVAEADVACKIDTNLVGVAVAVQGAYEQQYIDSHRDALDGLKDRINDYLAG